MTNVSAKRVTLGTVLGIIVCYAFMLLLIFMGCREAPPPLRPTFESKECPGMRVEKLESGCRNVVNGKFVDNVCCDRVGEE